MVHNGLRGHRQRYKCNECGRRFTGGHRRDKSKVITDYVEGKQTKEQLALRYGVSVRTISRDLLGMRYVQKIASMKDVTIQMDHLLGPRFRPNGDKGCPPQQDIVA